MNQNFLKLWWYVGGIAVIVIIAFAIWRFSSSQAPVATNTQTATSTPVSAIQQTQLPPLSSGNTTADIQNDLNQTSNGSAALNQDQNSVNASIQSL